MRYGEFGWPPSDHSRAFQPTQFDIKLGKWENGSVKTTLDLPDDLMRQVKIRAVQEDRKLKDMVADLLRLGLDRPTSALPRSRHRVKLPIIPAPPGAPAFDLNPDRLHELEMDAERERHEASLR